MIRATLSYLAFFVVVVMAIDDPTMACENQSSNDINFNLTKMNLDKVRRLFVSGSSITCINLAGNQIVHLEPGAFDGVPQLSYLNLAGNPVSFEDFMEMNFPALRSLVLDGPFIDDRNGNLYDVENEKHNPTSSYYTEGSYYKPNDIRLDNISSIFLPQLEKLSFRNYEAQPVLEWLRYLNVENLTHLNIAGNKIEELILRESFSKSITNLNVDDNKIHMFALNFPELRNLSMNRNEIKNVCNHQCDWNSLTLRGIPELEHLSLAGNKITSIEPDALEHADGLRSLDLAGNKISFLPKHVFDTAKSLKELSLARNELTEVPYLCELKELRVLNLNGNTIQTVDDQSFCGLSKLRYIDISRNNLVNVPDGTFAQLSALTDLDISWNNIATLPENWIGTGRILRSLHLDGNEFTDTANMSLGSIEKLDIISFGHNPLLRMVTVRSLSKLPPDTKIDVCRNCM